MRSRAISSPARVFIDSSVIIAASISARSYARDLIAAGLRGEVTLIWSDLVSTKTERNLQTKAPNAMPAFRRFRDRLHIESITPDPAIIRQAEAVIDPKDVPIVAAAIAGGADWIASYDRRYLLSFMQEILDAFGIATAPPDEILTNLS
jgi:predicted nucleic acid-binding protein